VRTSKKMLYAHTPTQSETNSDQRGGSTRAPGIDSQLQTVLVGIPIKKRKGKRKEGALRNTQSDKRPVQKRRGKKNRKGNAAERDNTYWTGSKKKPERRKIGGTRESGMKARCGDDRGENEFLKCDWKNKRGKKLHTTLKSYRGKEKTQTRPLKYRTCRKGWSGGRL